MTPCVLQSAGGKGTHVAMQVVPKAVVGVVGCKGQSVAAERS